MLVTPLPGTDRRHLLEVLTRIHTAAANLRGHAGPTAFDRLLAYLDWATEATRALQSLVRASDVDELVLTRRHDALLAGIGHLGGTDTQGVVNRLVSAEVDQRVAAFGVAIDAFGRRTGQWSLQGEFVMLDTSVYIRHPDKLLEIDFMLLAATIRPVHVLVPIAVVDELDRLKEIKDRHVRWRAGHTLGVLDQHTSPGNGPTVLRRGGIGEEDVTIEILFDPPRHVRLPIIDDEIIDRALAVEPLAGRRVTLITYDTGQSTRARAAGLQVMKLDRPAEEESS